MINRTRRHKAIGAGPDEDQAAGPETVPADKAMPVARQQRRAAQTPRPREVPRPASRDGGWPPRPDLADGLAWLAMRRRGVALCPKRWRPDAATRWPPYRSLPARSSVRLLNQLGRTQARKGGGLLPNVRSKDAGMGGSARRMGLGPDPDTARPAGGRRLSHRGVPDAARRDDPADRWQAGLNGRSSRLAGPSPDLAGRSECRVGAQEAMVAERPVNITLGDLGLYFPGHLDLISRSFCPEHQDARCVVSC